MKNVCLIICFVISQCCFADKNELPKGFKEQPPKQTITFIENKGQIRDQNFKPRTDILFSGNNGNLVYHIKNNGISYQLSSVDSWKEIKNQNLIAVLPSSNDKKARAKLTPDKITLYRVDIDWLNTNKNPIIVKGKTLPGYDNYYLAGCPDEGALNVKSYTDVTLKNIYNGIDIRYYEKNGQLEYDYIIAAGADFKQIKFNINGAENIRIENNGDLVINTPLGEIIEPAPIVKQNNSSIKVQWRIKNNCVSFNIEGVDLKQPFIIDPAVALRAWGTYYGGNDYDDLKSCSVDALGNVFISGTTSSINGIATSGGYQNILSYSGDNFLSKFDANGIRLWGTYYGGSGQESAGACNTDSFGNVYLFGTTTSTDVISTPGSFQPLYGGVGDDDAYLVKFNGSGVRIWGTYYGGIGDDNANQLVIDQQGNVYLYGYMLFINSGSGAILTTPGCHQSNFAGGISDTFIAKFSSSGSRIWGSYYGGESSDIVGQCCVDVIGNFYICGTTGSQSGSSIATANGHQPTFGGAAGNGFLAKFNTSGIRQWSTYYGGAIGTSGGGCAVDNNGDVYLCGGTSDTLVITTPLCHQPFSFQNAGYIVKFNSVGQRQWGTYYGNKTFLNSCIADNSNNIYVSGRVNSNPINSLIATSGSHQTLFGGGNSDACLAKFDSNGGMQWGSFYGGNGDDYCSDQGITFSSSNNGGIYITGGTTSTNGTSIASNGSHQSSSGGGGSEAFLAKFNDCTNSIPITCVGIKEFQSNQIKLDVFPNPSNGFFTIKAESELSLKIINELGQILQTINLNSNNNYSANVSNLNTGIYFITINNGWVKEKIVVIK